MKQQNWSIKSRRSLNTFLESAHFFWSLISHTQFHLGHFTDKLSQQLPHSSPCICCSFSLFHPSNRRLEWFLKCTHTHPASAWGAFVAPHCPLGAGTGAEFGWKRPWCLVPVPPLSYSCRCQPPSCLEASVGVVLLSAGSTLPPLVSQWWTFRPQYLWRNV